MTSPEYSTGALLAVLKSTFRLLKITSILHLISLSPTTSFFRGNKEKLSLMLYLTPQCLNFPITIIQWLFSLIKYALQSKNDTTLTLESYPAAVFSYSLSPFSIILIKPLASINVMKVVAFLLIKSK
jgi:hypothetical protein